MSGRSTNLRREILKAKGNKKPLIIVEAEDDRPFYEKIINEVTGNVEETKFNIYEIDMFGQGPGCSQIIKQFDEIKDWITDEMLEYVIGVIDRDSFYYLANEEQIAKRKDIKALFELDYYSYESHFVTKQTIKNLLYKITSCEKTKISEEIIDFLMDRIEKIACDELFYVGLECLRNGMFQQYQGIFKYNDDKREIGENNKRKPKLARIDKSYLDELANNKSINKDFVTIKKIVKGKHFLYSCSDAISYLIQSLEKRCIKEEHLSCKYEENCKKKTCSWKNQAGYKSVQIYHKLTEELDKSEVKYIVDEFSRLKFQVNCKNESNLVSNL